MAFLLNVELALSKGVPKLDGSVSASTDNLSVVSREGDGENIGGVADETAGGKTSVKVPESESVVPRGGQSELTVGRDNDVGDEVVVSVKDLFRSSVFTLIPGQLPDNDGLVYSEIASGGCNRTWGSRYLPRDAVKRRSGFSDEAAMARRFNN